MKDPKERKIHPILRLQTARHMHQYFSLWLILRIYFVRLLKLAQNLLLFDKLEQQNLVKELLYKGGLRCEILSDGEISVGDIIN